MNKILLHTSDREGRAEASFAGNFASALYLADMGLSQDAITFTMRAGPDDMTWLTPQNAAYHGIAFERTLPELIPAPVVTANVNPTETSSLRLPSLSLRLRLRHQD
jgi:hypothetical protein